MRKLEESGIIRGISPVLESSSLGLDAATLVALHVPEERLEDVAAVISRTMQKCRTIFSAIITIPYGSLSLHRTGKASGR